MRKISSLSITLFTLRTLVLPLSVAALETGVSRYQLYRLHNAAASDHLYTTSIDEIAAAQARGYVLEDTYSLLATRVVEEDQLPFYRMYHPGTGKHFYTDSTEEMTELALKKGGFVLEGILGYLAGTSSKTGALIYRLYHPQTSDHLYTTSWVEWGILQVSGWKDEGVLRGRLY